MFDGLRFKHWRTERSDDGIVILTLDRAESSVNTLNRAVLDELSSIVERLNIEAPRGVVVRSGKTAGFIAGADIGEFQTFDRNGTVLEAIQRGQRVFSALSRLRCPTVAAIHGHCMGGGLELSLACRYRVASRDPATRLALPEVKLGIHPGWGGSVRLPRLIGATTALDMMLSGRSLSAEAAKSAGLVDALTAPELITEGAIELVRRGARRSPVQGLKAWATAIWPVRQVLAHMVRKQVASKAKPDHYPAPYALIELWRRHGGNPSRMMGAEARSVAKLAQSPTARNLVRVFFLQEQLKSLGAGTEHAIAKVHVIGAGVMGGDIAAWCALNGLQVTLQDRGLEYIQPALNRAEELFAKRLKTPERSAAARARLVADVAGNAIADADLVIEAIFENLEAKQALLREVEPKLKSGALLATNTSSIPLTELRGALKEPGRFLGLHFFNPVALMSLLEVVRHDGLRPDIEARALAFGRAIDKLPVPVGSSTGFLVNRILFPYLLEAMTLYSEGVPGPVIDKAATKFGLPMGPIELADQIGLDVCASVGRILAQFLDIAVPPGLDALLQSGKRGKKDGAGFYVYQNGKPVKPEVDPNYRAPDDLTDRLILPMLNESVACLHEGVVASADLLDAGVIFGTGFAPFRGGPCQHIRSEGAAALKQKLEGLASKYGARFAPKPGWDAAALQPE